MQTVDICIPTYRRPKLLRRLFEETLCKQETDGTCSFRVIVCDNDEQQSARGIVEEFRDRLDIIYCVEARRNISHARNRTIEASDSDFVLLHDDDEIWASPDWVKSLVLCAEEFAADVVRGPASIILPENASSLIRECEALQTKMFCRGASENITLLGANSLVRRRFIEQSKIRFDPDFGQSGGEDLDFFWQLKAAGARFAWCPEAMVTSIFHEDRCTVAFMVRRLFNRGRFRGRAELIHYSKVFGRNYAIKAAKLVVLTAMLVLLLPLSWLSPAQYVRLLVKWSYHLGFVLFSVRRGADREYANPQIALE